MIFLHDVACGFCDIVMVIIPSMRDSSSPTYGFAFTILSHFSTEVVRHMHVLQGSAASLHSVWDIDSSSKVSGCDLSPPGPMHNLSSSVLISSNLVGSRVSSSVGWGVTGAAVTGAAVGFAVGVRVG